MDKSQAAFYDGINVGMKPDTALRLATEELGEVASAITRDRFNSARDECLDLAHCALLLYISLSESMFGAYSNNQSVDNLPEK
jgi:NTP pyrophosphatase (non-canonical NTP hydrolase)